MYNLPNRMELDMYDPPEPKPVFCPICGEECNFVIRSQITLEILGCDICTEEIKSEEMED